LNFVNKYLLFVRIN